ncbi:hypothetical protein B0H16DRAFT_1576030, partial [Mycena metata]
MPRHRRCSVVCIPFTSLANIYSLPDFRMIPIGDIDLRKELVVNKRSSIIGHGREYNCVRRVYSAKIEGRRSKVTVAVYQGDARRRRTGGETPKCICLFATRISFRFAEARVIAICMPQCSTL